MERSPRRRSQSQSKNKRKSKTYKPISYSEKDWPWTISIDLKKLEKPKVCFLSGKEREYFPEDPGRSRMGVEYSMNCRPGDTPNPSYVPSDDRLQKPISLLGYGWGGLSARRFAKDVHEKSPDPGAYQSKISSAFGKSRRKTVRDDYGNEIKPCEVRPISAFGSSMNTGQFEGNRGWQNVGVGHYEVGEIKPYRKLGMQTVKHCKPEKLRMDTIMLNKNSLMDNALGDNRLVLRGDITRKSQSRLTPSIKTYCCFEGPEKCVECGFRLLTMDYYRSKVPIKMPHPKSTPESVRFLPARFIPMCRKCLCHIMRRGHPFWTKRTLSQDFQKTRHCVNIHEHNGLPDFIEKSSSSLIEKLTRKETVMTKYFKDCCDRIVRERV